MSTFVVNKRIIYIAFVFAVCVLAVSFDKVRAFDLDSGRGQIKVVREQLMTDDTKDVEPLVGEAFCYNSQES